MKKILLSLVTTLAAVSAFADDPDLSGYTCIKTMDFTTQTYSADTQITLGNATGTTAYETGNARQQSLYYTATPADLTDYLAFQAVYGSKGWWIRSTKGGLYSIGATRSAAVVNLKKDYVVVLTCSQDAANVITLTNADGNADGNFTYVQSEDTKSYYCTMTDDGQIGFCGKKNAGYITSISVYAKGTVVVKPTAAYTGVNGNQRTVTFKGTNLAYNTDGGSSYTNFVDGDGKNVNEASVTVDGNKTYWVVSTNGNDKSEVLMFNIEAGSEVVLPTPTCAIDTMYEGFKRHYAVSCDTKDVLLSPSVKLMYAINGGDATEFDGKLMADKSGTISVYATADGYKTSDVVTIDNTQEYALDNTIDFTAIKGSDLSSNWKESGETALPGSSTQWPAYVTDATVGYWYDFSSETASATDIISGLDIEYTTSGKAPKLYEGLGLMYPIYLMDNTGTATTTAITSGNIAPADAKYNTIAVYTYANNYTKGGIKTSVITGANPFALYRFSDLLKKVEIFNVKDAATAINDVNAAEAEKAAAKYVENGKVVIVKNGAKYTVAGALLK